MYYRRRYKRYRRRYGFFHNCKWRKKYRVLNKKYKSLDKELRQLSLEATW